MATPSTPTPAGRRPAGSERGARTRRVVHGLLLVLAGIMLVDSLVGDRGLLAMRRARRQVAELEAAIERQRAENARLREEVRRLSEDPAAIEELARGELGLIRPGEKVFIIRDHATPAKP